MNYNNLLKIAEFIPKSLEAPDSWTGHMHFGVWLIKELSPNIFVELGTHSGNSYFSFCQSIHDNKLETKSYAIDTWRGDDHSGLYGENIYEYVNSHNNKNYSEFSTLLRMSFDDAVDNFLDESIDLLHIDGLHTYEATRHDFEVWLPKLAPGAIVIFHDTNIRERNFGVYHFWDELTKIYTRNIEFSHSNGLGVLQLNNSPENKKIKFLDLNSVDKINFINYFACLGENQLNRYRINENKKRNIHTNRDEYFTNITLTEESNNLELANANIEITKLNLIIDDLHTHITQINSRIFEYENSSSWKLLEPIRSFVRKSRLILKIFKFIIMNLNNISLIISQLQSEWKKGGVFFVKIKLKDLINNISKTKKWENYRDEYSDIIESYVSEEIKKLYFHPLISLIYYNEEIKNTNINELLNSLNKQLYNKWELFIIIDPTQEREIEESINKNNFDDSRIKIICLNNNLTTIFAEVLKVVTGEYISHIDANVKLEKQALFRIAETIIKDSPDLIYSDGIIYSECNNEIEDFILRPAFSIDFLKSKNYINKFVTYKIPTLLKLNKNIEIDMLLNNTELLIDYTKHSNSIIHIPEILFIFSNNINENKKLIKERKQIFKISEGDSFTESYDDHRVAIIIPTKNNSLMVKTCIESIEKTSKDVKYDIIIINHDSDILEDINNFKKLEKKYKILNYTGEFNFSEINNWAIERLENIYSHFLFCNNDIEAIENGWLKKMLKLSQSPKVGIVGAKLMYPNSNICQHVGVCVGMNGAADHFAKYYNQDDINNNFNSIYYERFYINHELTAVTAACLLIKREVFNCINGFDINFKVGFGDTDLCLRARDAGFKVMLCAEALLYHHESFTRGKSLSNDPHSEDTLLFKKLWNHAIKKGDHFFNPNLNLANADGDTTNPIIFNSKIKNRKVFIK